MRSKGMATVLAGVAAVVTGCEGTNLAGISGPLKRYYGDLLIPLANGGNVVPALTHPDASDLLARYHRQVVPIGAGSTTRLIEPADRQITRQSGLVWAERADGRHYLAQIYIENSSTGGTPTQPTTIRFRAFIDESLQDAALARARPNQPRGIQTLPWSAIRGISSPPPSTTVRE